MGDGFQFGQGLSPEPILDVFQAFPWGLILGPDFSALGLWLGFWTRPRRPSEGPAAKPLFGSHAPEPGRRLLGDDGRPAEENWKAGEGCTQFGEPPKHLILDRNKMELLVRSQAGMTAFFPSYYWHGVRPFGGSDTCHAIAFDII